MKRRKVSELHPAIQAVIRQNAASVYTEASLTELVRKILVIRRLIFRLSLVQRVLWFMLVVSLISCACSIYLLDFWRFFRELSSVGLFYLGIRWVESLKMEL